MTPCIEAGCCSSRWCVPSRVRRLYVDLASESSSGDGHSFAVPPDANRRTLAVASRRSGVLAAPHCGTPRVRSWQPPRRCTVPPSCRTASFSIACHRLCQRFERIRRRVVALVPGHVESFEVRELLRVAHAARQPCSGKLIAAQVEHPQLAHPRLHSSSRSVRRTASRSRSGSVRGVPASFRRAATASCGPTFLPAPSRSSPNNQLWLMSSRSSFVRCRVPATVRSPTSSRCPLSSSPARHSDVRFARYFERISGAGPKWSLSPDPFRSSV